MKLRTLTLISVTFASLVGPSDALAQSTADQYRLQLDRIRRETLLQASPEVPAGQRAFIDYGAYLTMDYLSVDDGLGENHILRQYDLIGYTRMNFDGAQELFLRFRTTYRDFNEGDSFDGRGDGFQDPDFDIAYYRFDLARYLGAYRGQETDGNLIVQVGRDIVYWGNGLALGQVLDGASVTFRKGIFDLTAIAGVTPVRTVDFEASRPDFDFNTRRSFYGIMASAQLGPHRPFVYYLLQQDYNKDEVLQLGNVTTNYGYDSYYVGAGSVGNIGDKVAYSAELAYEGGRGQSNSFSVSGPLLTPIEQTTDSVSAFAADLRVDYLLMDPRRTRFTTEFLLATGDDDRLHTSNTFAGNAPNTIDKAYNGFGLINTGQAFAPVVSNLLMARAGISSFPFTESRWLRRMQVGADLFVYGKLETDAPIDETTDEGRYLGWEPDLYLNWQVTSDVTFAMRYGIFFPNSDVFGDEEAGQSRQFFSTSVTVSF